MPSSEPLVTVAMVTYKSEKYVADAIESVLRSSYSDLELIISDDCSPDNTWEIIKRYSDPRIRAYRNPQNLGEYPNRNRALDHACGKYLIYIDGDDLIYPHGLEFMVRMLEAFPQSAMALAHPRKNHFVYPVELSPRQFYLCEFLGPGVAGQSFCNIFFRTSVLKGVGGLDARFSSSDICIQYIIARTYPCLLINDGLAYWRRRPGQATELLTKNQANWLEALQYKREALGHPDCPLSQEETTQALINLYGQFMRMTVRCFLRGRAMHALRLLAQAHIPIEAWKYIAMPSRYDYLSGISSEPLLTSDPCRNPYANLAALSPRRHRPLNHKRNGS
jgi:hypothetical protein